VFSPQRRELPRRALPRHVPPRRVLQRGRAGAAAVRERRISVFLRLRDDIRPSTLDARISRGLSLRRLFARVWRFQATVTAAWTTAAPAADPMKKPSSLLRGRVQAAGMKQVGRKDGGHKGDCSRTEIHVLVI
jgi:hypothetical protein